MKVKINIQQDLKDIIQDYKIFAKTLYVIHSPSQGKTLDYTFSKKWSKNFLEGFHEEYVDAEIMETCLGAELFQGIENYPDWKIELKRNLKRFL